MHIISRMQSLLPDGRYAMSYRVDTGITGVYLLQFNEIVTKEEALVTLPSGILTGRRPTAFTLKGGCYDISFDRMSNIEEGTPFRKKRERGQRSAALNCIVDYIINNHYTAYRPYCYTFLAFDELLSRAYRLSLLKLCRTQPNLIATLYRNLDPDRRGYAVKLR